MHSVVPGFFFFTLECCDQCCQMNLVEIFTSTQIQDNDFVNYYFGLMKLNKAELNL